MENAKEPITRYVEDRYAKLNEFVSMQPDMKQWTLSPYFPNMSIKQESARYVGAAGF